MSDASTFPNRIRELRESRGWSATYLGQLAGGMAGPTVTRLETGVLRLKFDQAKALSEALGVTVEELTGKGEGSAAPQPASRLTAPPNARFAGVVDLPTRSSMRRDLPIYGTAAGSDGNGAFFLNFGDVVDRAWRPPGLAGNTKAYGLYVEGSSMAPVFDHGAFVVADPTRKVRAGDNVVVIVINGEDEHSEPMAYVKEFVRQTATELHLKQHNPAVPLVIAKRRVVPDSMHRLLTLAEVMGLG